MLIVAVFLTLNGFVNHTLSIVAMRIPLSLVKLADSQMSALKSLELSGAALIGLSKLFPELLAGDSEADLVGSDEGTDIALLGIEANRLKAVELGDSSSLKVGDFVVAIGNPFGLSQTVTSGIVSALGRSGLNVEGHEDFIQTDASINPGNSVGALIDPNGRLVGINAAITSPAGGNVGIGFAVPAHMGESGVA